MRRLLLVCSPLALAGCFTTSADFQRDAEQFILQNEELSAALDTTFSSAACEDPERSDVGTTFTCTGIDEQNRTWEFEVEITASDEYEVNVTRFP